MQAQGAQLQVRRERRQDKGCGGGGSGDRGEGEAGSFSHFYFSHPATAVSLLLPVTCPHSPQRHCQRKPHCRGMLLQASLSHFPAQSSTHPPPTSNISHISPTEVQRRFDNGAFKWMAPAGWQLLLLLNSPTNEGRVLCQQRLELGGEWLELSWHRNHCGIPKHPIRFCSHKARSRPQHPDLCRVPLPLTSTHNPAAGERSSSSHFRCSRPTGQMISAWLLADPVPWLE